MNPLLRPWATSDASALIAARHSADDLASQFVGEPFASVEEAAAYIHEYLIFGAGAKNWAIVAGERAVGNVGLSNIEFRHNTAWAYYWLTAEARGQGLAARALATVVAWGFENDVFRIELGHRVNNPASGRVAERAGFIAEGIERQKLRYGDERFDVRTMSRLATDPAPPLELLPLAVDCYL
jgi:RimJ/RimL family protein N-acetyltransferase